MQRKAEKTKGAFGSRKCACCVSIKRIVQSSGLNLLCPIPQLLPLIPDFFPVQRGGLELPSAMALTVNPTIYTSCIEQFWETAKANTVNGERQIQALVDKNKVIITESNIRSDLHLEDAGGTDCLPTATIFEELARIGRITPLFETMMVQPTQDEGVDSGIPTDSLQTPITTQPSSSKSQKKQSKRKQRKDTAVSQEEIQQDDSVPTPSNDPPLCAKEIAALKKRVQKLERNKKSRTTRLQRLRKVSMSRRVESSEDKESLGDHEDASKQRRSIEDIDKDDDVHASTTIEEITLARTLIQIKVAKPKVVTTAATTPTTTRPKARGVIVQEPSEFRTPQESQSSMIKDKGKAIMIEPEVPLKRKDQVALDEDLARNLQAQLEAELIKEERLARKKEEEANIDLIEKQKKVLKVQKMKRTDKSKKAETSEEKAKGSRKNMLGKKRAGKE
ncbi:hypothetical protein Tco_0213192 [Tanacetum coccineum]